MFQVFGIALSFADLFRPGLIALFRSPPSFLAQTQRRHLLRMRRNRLILAAIDRTIEWGTSTFSRLMVRLCVKKPVLGIKSTA